MKIELVSSRVHCVKVDTILRMGNWRFKDRGAAELLVVLALS